MGCTWGHWQEPGLCCSCQMRRNLQGKAGCKESAPDSLSLGVGKGRREKGEGRGKEAPFNYLQGLFPWRWLRKRVRTFSVETNSGSHSPRPEPRRPCGPLCCLGTEEPGRDAGTGAVSLSCVSCSEGSRGVEKRPLKAKAGGAAGPSSPRRSQWPVTVQDVAVAAMRLSYFSCRAAQRIGSLPQ